jgi:hypothetical protein
VEVILIITATTLLCFLVYSTLKPERPPTTYVDLDPVQISPHLVDEVIARYELDDLSWMRYQPPNFDWEKVDFNARKRVSWSKYGF